MAIEVTLNEEEEQEYPYPYIGKGTHNIVLFTKPNTGTVLESMSGGYAAGYHQDTWGERDHFKPLTGSITLSNK